MKALSDTIAVVAQAADHVGTASSCDPALRDLTFGAPGEVTSVESLIVDDVSDPVIGAANDCEPIGPSSLFDIDVADCRLDVRNLARR